MAWLIAALVFVVPLVFFPRAAGYILLAAVLSLGAWALYEGIENRLATAEEEKVAITAVFDPVACPAETPVAARVSNGGSKSVVAVKFDISVKRRGYGNEIGRLSRLLDDQPIAPAATSLFCYALPVLIPPLDPKELEFSVPLQFVTFQ
jgi:hypothetical protein